MCWPFNDTLLVSNASNDPAKQLREGKKNRASHRKWPEKKKSQIQKYLFYCCDVMSQNECKPKSITHSSLVQPETEALLQKSSGGVRGVWGGVRKKSISIICRGTKHIFLWAVPFRGKSRNKAIDFRGLFTVLTPPINNMLVKEMLSDQA